MNVIDQLTEIELQTADTNALVKIAELKKLLENDPKIKEAQQLQRAKNILASGEITDELIDILKKLQYADSLRSIFQSLWLLVNSVNDEELYKVFELATLLIRK